MQNICHKHTYTTPYHPSGNICERINRKIKAIHTSYIGSDNRRWGEYLHVTALALRTAISDITGFSLSMLNLEREMQLPSDRNLEAEYNGSESRIQYQTEYTKNSSQFT